MKNLSEEKQIVPIIQKKRNLGIDFLRIVSMIMIVLLHVLNHGGILSNLTNVFTFKYQIIWFIEIMAFCSVNCYALISGYVGVEAKFRYSNIVVLWLQVIFYTIFITGISVIIFSESITLQDILKTFFPVMFGTYWYFTAYFGMFFFIPVLNYLIKNLPRKEMERLICSIVVLFSILSSFFYSNVFQLEFGYSMLWLSILYVIGGYIYKYKIFENVSKEKLIEVYLIAIFLTWSSRLCIETLTTKLLGEAKFGGALITYISPTILIASVALLSFFSKIDIKEKKGKVVKLLAPLTLGVYLIHDNPIIRRVFIKNAFSNFTNSTSIVLLGKIFLTVSVIYIICLLVEWCRSEMFRRVKIKKKIQRILKEEYL